MSQRFQDTANLLLGTKQNAIDPNASSNLNANATNGISNATNGSAISTLNENGIQVLVPAIISPPDSIYQALVYSIGNSIIVYTNSCSPNTENLVHSYYNLDPNNNISLNTSCLLNTQFDLQIRNNIISEFYKFNFKLLDSNSLQNLIEHINLKEIQNCLAQRIAKDKLNSTVSGLSKTVIYQFIDGCIQTNSENKQYVNAFIKLNTVPPKKNYNFVIILIVAAALAAILFLYKHSSSNI